MRNFSEFHVRQAICILRNAQALILNFLQSRQTATFYECIIDRFVTIFSTHCFFA